MEKEVVGPSGQQFQRDSTTVVGQRLAMGQRVRVNASVQTDEEFSLELLQDCATSRGVANIPITDQVKLERGKFNDNENGHAGYEEFTSIYGPRRKDSDCNHDSSDVALRKGYTVKVENRSNSHNVSPYYENGDDIKELKKSFREMNDYQAVSRTSTPHIPVLDTHDSVPFGSRTSNSSRLGKIKLLCSFGGKILPRPSDGKLRYVGGETRIISIRKNLSWIELVKKTSEICKQPHTIKYQLPGEGLDALISVSCDEDFQNMLEEYQGIEKVDGQKLRLFLISKNESKTASFETMVSEHCGTEYQYVVAINCIADRSPRKSSGDTLGQNLDGPYHGMPHALQEHGEKANHCSQEGITSSSPLDFSNTISPEWINSIAWQKESIRAPEIQNKLPNNKSTTMPKTFDLPKFSHILENSVKAEYIHIGTHDLAGKSQTTNEVSNLISLDHCPKVLELMAKNDSFLPHSEEHHVNDTISTFSNIKQNTISVHGVYSDSKMTHVSRTATSVSLSALEEKAEGYQLGLMIYEPLVKDQRTSEVGDVNKIPSCDAKFCDGESSLTNPYCGSSLGISCPSSFALDVASQKEKHDQESRLISTVRSDALAVEDTSHQRLNLRMMKDSFSCSSSHQENVDASLKRDALQLDDLFVNYPNKNDNEVDPWGYPHKSADLEHHTFVSPEQVHNFGREVQPESVIIEEATDSMLQHIESSSKVVAHVQDKDLLPRLTDSNAEGEVDHRDKDESISDAAVKIDASAYDLQIIRNADLEELRELGSGAFGTVYHGKWRGTDVAIKRIKKSCFSGRSSEKMRLTNDFWREAHILSKLHHPNIVAFYGAVPDGSGGTLATVTEFMVNGSLRHVLSKKDRTLDRSKKLMIAMDAAFGMEYLHLKNIVHFDLKCDNLLVNLRDPQRPVCKVADFGLSKIKRNTLVSGGVRGTLPWMAPELLNAGSIQVSEKVDVFSFGIAMWEILTGEEPYANMHCGAIIGGIMNNTLRPTIPDRCDPGWKKLMEQCWAAEPSVRPSFTEITNRLRNMSMALQTRGSTKR